MKCEGDPFVGHAHGIAFVVGGKFDVDGVVREIVEKVPVGEGPVCCLLERALGKFILRRLLDRLLGRLLG